MRTTKRILGLNTLVTMLTLTGIPSAFDPKDCASCKFNHANFGDDFDKSGHCYMFREVPSGRCAQRSPIPGVSS